MPSPLGDFRQRLSGPFYRPRRMSQRESAYSMAPGNRTRQANRCWSLLNRLGSRRGLTALAYFLLLLSPSPSAAQALRDALPLPPGLALLPGGEARAILWCDPFAPLE